MFQKKIEVYVLERIKNTASGNSASGHPQHLGSNSFDCCPRRHEIVVYCSYWSNDIQCCLHTWYMDLPVMEASDKEPEI